MKTSIKCFVLICSALMSVSFCGAVDASSKTNQASTEAQPTSGFDLDSFIDYFAATLPAVPDFYGIRILDAWKAMQKEPNPFVLDVRAPLKSNRGYRAQLRFHFGPSRGTWTSSQALTTRLWSTPTTVIEAQ